MANLSRYHRNITDIFPIAPEQRLKDEGDLKIDLDFFKVVILKK
jgi:hypothetical protein